MSVTTRVEPLVIPTYPVGAPEKNPVFFEKRVYQGCSGKVYPVPFIDKMFDEPADVTYQSARIEDDFVRLVMLPEIAGRIFIGQDRSNADYDFFYRQDVIKPILVGLASPWISGGKLRGGAGIPVATDFDRGDVRQSQNRNTAIMMDHHNTVGFGSNADEVRMGDIKFLPVRRADDKRNLLMHHLL